MTEQTKAQRARRRWAKGQSRNGARGDPEPDQGMRGQKVPEQFWRPRQAASSPASLRNVTETAPALSSLATVALMGLGLLALELTNAATSYWALADLMGGAGLLGITFPLMLTLGLAALDTGGLLRLFGPGAERLNRTSGLYFVMGAWLLCGTFNALGTWWAVASAMGDVAGNALLSQAQLLNVAPVFVAVALWLMRVMLVAGWAQGEGV